MRADATGMAWNSNSFAGVEGLVGGELRGYQFVYRDPGGPCAEGFNASNGILVQR